jgi:hypothetical protein
VPTQGDAQAAIGVDDDEADWKLRPQEHAKALPPAAGALKRVLEGAGLQEIIDRFEAADAAAVAAQASYKRIGRLGLYAATAATIAGAIFLLPVERALEGRPGGIASALQIAALLVAFLAARWLALAKPFDRWMKQRAEAEIARIGLFDAVAAAEEPDRPGELPLLPLVLEYFRRYQLDVQRRYYRGRSAQHAAAVWRNNNWVRASLLFTFVSVLVALLASLHVLAAWQLPVPGRLAAWSAQLAGPEIKRIVLALGVIASGFYGVGVARSLMDLDERNASRYLVTADNLDYLRSEGLARAREAAASGDRKEVVEFIRSVQNLISSEHREWIVLSKREDKSDLARLRQTRT